MMPYYLILVFSLMNNTHGGSMAIERLEEPDMSTCEEAVAEVLQQNPAHLSAIFCVRN